MAVPVEMRVPSALIHPLSSSSTMRSSSSINSKLWRQNNPPSLLLHCIPGPIQMDLQADGILCDCNGKGWVICDFCQGQKTNVKANNNRLYRRCPSCKAIGSILCPKCKVFKCVTFPNDLDNGDGSEEG